jgi:uncharacterized protein (DUF927 family)
LKEVSSNVFITRVKQSGWIKDTNNYICPSFQVVSGDKNIYEFVGDGDYGYAISGTLEEWQKNVCRYCEDNSILALALCHGLSGIIRKHCAASETTVINLVGESSKGKTTTIKVIASLWGKPSYVKQWNATPNALEVMAKNHSDTLLLSDGFGVVNAKEIGSAIYRLCNGQGRSRLNRDACMKPVDTWPLSILSTGEKGLEDKLNEAGEKAKAGQLVRCIEIGTVAREEWGTFNDPHGFSEPRLLAEHLAEQSARFYGVASEAFVRGLLSKGDIAGVIEKTYKAASQMLTEKFGLTGADGVVSRATNAFARAITAGWLASDSGFRVFTHTAGQVTESIGFTFERWLETRGGKTRDEGQEIVDYVKDILASKESQLIQVRMDSGNASASASYISLESKYPVRDAPGYISKEPKRTVYFLIVSQFNKEMCREYGYRSVRRALKKAGILEAYGSQDNKKINIDGERKRMIQLVFLRGEQISING